MRLDHLIPEKNVLCAVATAILSVIAAHALNQAGVSISPDGTTCITATRAQDVGLPYLTVDQLICMVSALSVVPAYVWDCFEKYRAGKKGKKS